MAFRDNRDAQLARSDALARELEETKRALAETEQELALAKNPPRQDRPPPPAQDLTPDRAPGPTRAEAKEGGQRFAVDLFSNDAATAKAARAELRSAPPTITDAAARYLVVILREGGAEAEAVCRVLAENDAPRFGGRSYFKVLKALRKAARGSGSLQTAAQQAMQKFTLHGMDNSYVKKKQAEKSADASTNIVSRLLSVFKRAWVIAVWGFPVLFGGIAIATKPAARVPVAIALLLLTVFVVVVDSFKRRCPKCRKLLAGKLLSVVADNYGGRDRSWSCAFCARRWKT